MISGSLLNKNIDSSNISAELLHLTLSACRAGLFYTPVFTESNVINLKNRFVRNSEQAWSINVGPLYGLDAEPKDASELMLNILESDRSILLDATMHAIDEHIQESECEYRIRRPDGEVRWLLTRLLLGLNEQGEIRYIVSMIVDITDQKQEQERLSQLNTQLETAQKLLQSALRASDIAIFRTPIIDKNDESYNEQTVNSDIQEQSWSFNLDNLYGFPEGTKTTHEMQAARMQAEDVEAISTKIKKDLSADRLDYQHEYPVLFDDKSIHWLLLKCSTEPQLGYLSGAIIDITERKIAENRTNHLATHDVLTDLPNRLKFSTLLAHTIEKAKRYDNCFALFFIDLDRFKAINDALGHQAGDRLLIDIAHRLQNSLRAADVLARISGDEFVLLAPEIDNEEKAGQIARKIIAEVCKPLTLLGHKCQVTASVGICLFPDHGDDEETLLKNSDSAMYMAKEAGKNNYQFFNARNTSQSLQRMSMENELRTAMENNELYLEYQAKLDLRDDEITGVEALLRWKNPTFGNVSPAQFIPIAEEASLIVPIGRWVLNAACKQNVEWQKQGLSPICISVNVSARQFLSLDFLEHIKEALDESGMEPQLLELEITESMVMHRVDEALAQLHEIKKLGALIAIDDFGTGYSSLAQLKRFPIDTLKVDRSFIREVEHDAEDQAITEAIIAMGKSMNLTIIAEGVETEAQQEFLRKRDCDEMQGFYFSRPVTACKFSQLLRQYSASEDK